MYKILTAILVFFSFSSFASAQYSEVGVSLGVSNYLGDLVPPKTYLLGTNLAGGINYQFNLNSHLALQGGFIMGSISGDDQNSDYDSGRRQRNLKFRSPLYEFSIIGKLYILPFYPSPDRKPVSPYIFGGIAYFHFNPHTTYKGDKVYLQPLGTEGQGMAGYGEQYRLWGWSIPFGGGLKFNLNRRLNIAVEVGCRKTFTDYLDDVSGQYVALAELRAGNGALAAELSNRSYNDDGAQVDRVGEPRGHSGKDWYIVSQVALSYTLQGSYYFQPKRKFQSKRKRPNARPKKNTGRWM
jgi:hypothetical protein